MKTVANAPDRATLGRHLACSLRAGVTAGLAIGAIFIAWLVIQAPHYFTTTHRTLAVPLFVITYSSALFGLGFLAMGSLIGIVGRVVLPVANLAPNRLYRSLAVATVPAWVAGQFITWNTFRGRTTAALWVSNITVIVAALIVVVILFRTWKPKLSTTRPSLAPKIAWSIYGIVTLLSLTCGWAADPSTVIPAAPSPNSTAAADTTPVRAVSQRTRQGQPRDPAHTIILITIDTLRADRLGCYGHTFPTSPNIDRLASESVLFSNMFAHSSGTIPSVCSIFAGTDPVFTEGISQRGRLGEHVDTLAELLSRAGYKTSATVCQGMLTPDNGFAQGFDEFKNIPVKTKQPELVTQDAIAKLGAGSPDDKRFFWFHYLTPHTPYDPPPELTDRFKRPATDDPRWIPAYQYSTEGGVKPSEFGQRQKAVTQDQRVSATLIDAIYDAGVAQTDASIGQLLDHMRSTGLWDHAAILLSADHGEALGEAGVYGRHCVSLHDPLVRVPLLIRWPTVTPARHRWQTSVLTSDLPPTILAMAGLAVPESMTGRSVLPLIESESPRWPARPVVLQTAFPEGMTFRLNSQTYNYPDWALIDGGYKFIYYSNSVLDEIRTPLNYINAWRELMCGHIRPDELYRFGEDVDPPHGALQGGQHAKRAAAMRRQLLSSAPLRYLRSGQPPRQPAADEDELERLRSLGYIGAD